MNSFFNAVIGRLTLGIAFLMTIGTASAQTGAAGVDSSTNPGSGPGANSAVVNYLGAQDDMLIFNVSYNNPGGKKFVVLITDQQGNQLYQDIFRDKSFYRQFRVPKTNKDVITFAFRSGQNAPVEKEFAVNVNSHIVQEVAIKKL
ncbi:MAG TPA: hypothetical protein VL978_09190 [Puia sp.]|nr:hypothetical protein [Puia sp.]